MTKWATISILLSHFCSCQAQKTTYCFVDLPNEVRETSGLFFHNDQLYTHNDSGDGPYLYSLNLSDQKNLKKHKLTKANNQDWEDASRNETYIYIADTGNNKRKRKKMSYYRVLATSLTKDKIEKEEYEKINFRFKNKDLNTIRVNVEAMLVEGDKLYFLSKENYGKTKIFELIDGADQALEVAEMAIPFRITGADIRGNTVYVIGYQKFGNDNYQSMAGKINGWNQKPWENLHFQQLDVTFTGQGEGIAIHNDTIYITTEKNRMTKARLYKIPLSEIK